LTDRAQEMIERFGYRDPPADVAYGWTLDREYLAYARAGRGPQPWPSLESGRTRTALFWYRTSAGAMNASADHIRPTETDPPLVESDMRLVRLDPQGRLVEFHSIPPQVESGENAAGGADPWGSLFDAAGLTLASFHEVPSRWSPRGDADVRRAWEGRLPELGDQAVRVEAAAHRGRPIFFSVLPPWTTGGRSAAAPRGAVERLLSTLTVVLTAALLIAAAGLARRHLRTGRGDRRGAFRTAAVLFVALSFALILGARVYAAPEVEYENLARILSVSLYLSTTVWLTYVALEPYVRRFWPQLLIGWTRALSGRLRDPLVGRDILVGVAAGMVGALLIASRMLVPRALGWPLATPQLPEAAILYGTRFAMSSAVQILRRAIVDSMQIVGIVVFLKIVLRRNWVVLLLGMLAVMPLAMSGTFAGEQLALELAISMTGIALVFTVLLRFGLLSLVITIYTFLALEGFPLTTNLSRPYAGAAVLLSVALVALSLFGFYASRGDEQLFGRPLLD
jgi:serine/threonine-protein kinase